MNVFGTGKIRLKIIIKPVIVFFSKLEIQLPLNQKHMNKLAFIAAIALLFFASCKDKPQELPLEHVIPKVEEAEKDTIQTQLPAAQPIEKPADKYFLIAGSFLKEEQAETYKSELEKQGFPAQVVQRSWGLNSEYYRVAMYGFHEKTDAYAELSKAQQEGKAVWLLIK